ncbi:unnamed protein product [Adineta steineri]|uniref:Metalloendopeptidase n=1 Tax=Adineta steineri TaxID=433720 RepID=A0A814RJW3_9BILA|nr:unnamed protein product [Adineta steineri]CAF4110670.1 unnamed protein product [Adineta steineri]
MHSFKYFIITLLNLVINIQCAPISQSNATSKSGFIGSPEYNYGLQEGDMVPPPDSNSVSARGLVIEPAATNQWPGGIVPYEFASNISTNDALFIEVQMRAMENLTMVNNTQCIKFRPKNASDLYFITILNGSGCSAPVGSWGTRNVVRPVSLLHGLHDTCMVSGIVQHELSHVLGMHHEQSRPDRDSYVSIQWANIDPANIKDFVKFNNSEVETLMTSYDYASVMHYGWNAFAINASVPTIIPTMNSSAVLGQRVQLSPVDIIEIQRYYGCIPTPYTTNTITTTSTPTINTTRTATVTTTSITEITTVTTSSTTHITTVATINTTQTATASSTNTTRITISSTQTISMPIFISLDLVATTTEEAGVTSIGARSVFPLYFEIHFICAIIIIYLTK